MPSAELITYFTAEKKGGILLACLGLASLCLAVYLVVNQSSFAAMAWPLAIVGIFQLVVGVTVAARTPSQVAALQERIQLEPQTTAARELLRMERIITNFRIVKAAEIACIVAGLFLVLFLPRQATWSTVGLGLLVEAAVLFAFDVFAHQRALRYTSWLSERIRRALNR